MKCHLIKESCNNNKKESFVNWWPSLTPFILRMVKLRLTKKEKSQISFASWQQGQD